MKCEQPRNPGTNIFDRRGFRRASPRDFLDPDQSAAARPMHDGFTSGHPRPLPVDDEVPPPASHPQAPVRRPQARPGLFLCDAGTFGDREQTFARTAQTLIEINQLPSSPPPSPPPPSPPPSPPPLSPLSPPPLSPPLSPLSAALLSPPPPSLPLSPPPLSPPLSGGAAPLSSPPPRGAGGAAGGAPGA